MSELVATRPGTATAPTTAEPPAAGLGGWLQLFLFVIGIAAGVAVNTVVSPPPPPNPYAELPLVGEPPEPGALVRAILSNDARGLALQYDAELLQSLGPALEPLMDIFEMKFVGATERYGDILASYVAVGRNEGGGDFAAGVVFRISGGKVVGVN